MASRRSSIVHLAAGQIWDYFQLYGFSLAFACFLLRLLYKRYGSPLRQYPGPLFASCSRLWQVWVAWTGLAEEHYMDAHRRYGRIVRIGPNEVSFASPSAALDLFRTGKGFHKTEFYTVFLPDGRKDIFTEIREPLHAVKKRFAVPAYNIVSIQQHTDEIEAVMTKFLSRIDNFADPGQLALCDLGSWLHYLAFDTLGQFAFAKTFGFLDVGNDMDGSIYAISKSTYESGIIGQIPLVDKFTRSNPLWKYLPFLPENKAAVFFRTATNMLSRYNDPNIDEKNTKSLLKSLLDAHNNNRQKFSMDDVLAISMGAVAAGSDSTASTMQSFVWHVLSNPEVHDKLVAELVSSPLSEMVQFKEAQALPYFQACLKEAMRLQPAVGFNITRSIPKGGAVVDGTWLPGGTQVAVNAWVLHRDKTIFGHDAESFNPERWLTADGDSFKAMERCMFQFGGGSHVCIGRHLALFEMNKILPLIFRRYEMRLVDPKPLDHVTGFFYIQSGLKVYIQRRQSAQTK